MEGLLVFKYNTLLKWWDILQTLHTVKSCVTSSDKTAFLEVNNMGKWASKLDLNSINV